MPPIVARFEVESSGAKNSPWGLRAALSWSLTTPASTRTVRPCGSIDRIRFMCRDRSTTSPSLRDCPLVPVPPPRGAIRIPANRSSESSLAIRTRSSRSRGKATACGVSW